MEFAIIPLDPDMINGCSENQFCDESFKRFALDGSHKNNPVGPGPRMPRYVDKGQYLIPHKGGKGTIEE